MNGPYPIEIQRALQTLEFAIYLLQLTAAVALAACCYGIWRWHRNRWK